jgi:hypothetical protein
MLNSFLKSSVTWWLLMQLLVWDALFELNTYD